MDKAKPIGVLILFMVSIIYVRSELSNETFSLTNTAKQGKGTKTS